MFRFAKMTRTVLTNLRCLAASALVITAAGNFCACTGQEPVANAQSAANCIPGAQVSCACTGGGQGVQQCLSTGNAFGSCTGCAVAADATTGASDVSGLLDGDASADDDAGSTPFDGVASNDVADAQGTQDSPNDAELSGEIDALGSSDAADIVDNGPGADADAVFVELGSCGDGKKNGEESDVDCGGAVCSACGVGKACAVGLDCETGICINTTCQAAVACSDGKKNNLETDIDCGGASCAPCPDGNSCITNLDCQLKSCVAGKCQLALPKCNDGQKNGSESDLDCGGTACGPCPNGSNCFGNADCNSGSCAGGKCKAVILCADAQQNGTETDIDCGGSCPACGPNKACVIATDCTSGLCANSLCTSPSCSDQVKNGKEVDVDCGGSASGCIPCAQGKVCKVAEDCLSQYCLNGACKPKPSCSDGAKNGGETDIDCGGSSCSACAPGKTCFGKGDCNGGACLNNYCQKVDCTIPLACDDASTCTNDSCEPGGCSYVAVSGACSDGDACTKADSCVAGKCQGGTVGCDDGNVCTVDSCDPAGGCKHANAAGACEDGNPCTIGDVCSGGVCLAGTTTSCPPAPGDIVITEIMHDPDATGDVTGEWFEVINASNKTIELNGLEVIGNSTGEKFVVTASLACQPGQILVFANNADSKVNGGVKVDYTYPTSYTLSNSVPELIDLQWKGVTIDKVSGFTWGGIWPVKASGSSLSLSGNKTSAAANDSSASWCLGSAAWSSTDKGSPGKPNPNCAVPVPGKSGF